MNFLLDGFLQAIKLLASGDAETFSAIRATVMVSGYSMGASLSIGIPLGFCLGYFNFRTKKSIRTLVDTLMALPTVFIGLLFTLLLLTGVPWGSSACCFPCPALPSGRPFWHYPSLWV